ncbi:MAG: hypothetical protein ACK4Z4_14730, partial [Ferrovibrio sp.]
IAQTFGLQPVKTLAEAFAGASLVVFANNHPCFADMPVEQLAETMQAPGLIYDYWNNFDSTKLSLPAGVAYMALGSHRITAEGVQG